MSGIVGQNLGRASGLVKSSGVGADAVDSANIADDAIDSEHYTDGSIDNAHLADDAVGLAEMASGTDGQIITYDASGNPTAVGPGSDGEVLTSTGAGSPPAFEAASGGNFVRTGYSTGTTLSMSGCFTDAYVNYVIYATVTNTGSDNTFLNLRFMNESDGTMSEEINHSAIYTVGNGSTPTVYTYGLDSTTTSTIRLSIGDDINESFNYVINVTRWDGNDTFFTWNNATEDWTNGKSQRITGAGVIRNGATDIGGCNFLTNAGTSLNGFCVCYGVKYD